MRFLLLISVVTLHATISSAMAVEGTQSEALRAVTGSANTFAPKFIKSISRSQNGNVICSPISASMVLSMAAYGARENTAKQMRNVLALPEDDGLAKNGFQAFIDSFNNYNQVELRMANKMFVKDNIEPKAEFKSMAKAGFRSEPQNVNFANSAEASKTINDWCEAQTNHRIKDLIKPDDVGPSTLMVLVNAVYFKGMWASKFHPENTKPRTFHLDANTEKDVPTMYSSGNYRYGELPEVKAKFIELPYQSEGVDDSVSMFVILPDEIDGLAELMDNIEKVTIAKLLRGSVREVNLYLPKFKIESTIPLNDVLTEMGMSDMFTDFANFSGIIDSPPLKVTKVLQKAFIEVNEEGSEAAAATGLIAVLTALPPPPFEFRIDRPFAYAIATTKRRGRNGIPLPFNAYNGAVMFAGSVVIT